MKRSMLIAITVIAVITMIMTGLGKEGFTAEVQNTELTVQDSTQNLERYSIVYGYAWHPNKAIACQNAKNSAQSTCFNLGGYIIAYGECTYTLIQNPGELAYWFAEVYATCSYDGS